MRAFLLRLAVMLPLLVPAPADAESAPGGSSGSETQERPGLFTDLMDAIDSGSRLLIDMIQPGGDRNLVINPRYNSQDSPRNAVMTLIAAMELVHRGYEDEGYGRALASLPADAGRGDADTLYQILLRVGPVSPAEIPGIDQAATSGDTRYEYFPRGTDHLWIWQAAEPPTGAMIALERDGDAWRFTPETIDGAPDLLEALAVLPPRYGPHDGGQYFLRVFAPLVEDTGLYGWGAFLATTALGVLGGVLLARILARLAARAQRAERIFLASRLRGAGKAGGLVFFAVVFTAAIGFLELGSVRIVPRTGDALAFRQTE